MRRVAIIAQRAGKEIIGGAETHAMLVAQILSQQFDVDILTSCAISADTWANEYPEGAEKLTDTLKIVRFKTDFERSKEWQHLNAILLNHIPLDRFSSLKGTDKKEMVKHIADLPIAFCNEWMKRQGPYSSDLLEYIAANNDTYDYFLFFTYLYPTTYFGVDQVKDASKVRLIPTYHDEPVAYVPILKKYAKYLHLFSTDAEKIFVEQVLYKGNHTQNDVIHYGIEDRFEANKVKHDTPSSPNQDYLLYAGRLEGGKGVAKLYDYFTKYYEKYGDLKLITIGGGSLSNFKHKAVSYQGFVSEAEKLRLMKNALAFVHPSAYESMSIVVLESFMLETPCLVNAECEVLKAHIDRSKGGLVFDDYLSFEKSVRKIKENQAFVKEAGKKGRVYFLEYYQMKSYQDRLLNTIFV